jgi:hypothetical protein
LTTILDAMLPSMAILDPLTSRIKLSPERLTTETLPPARKPRLARNLLVSSLPEILEMVALSPTLHIVIGKHGPPVLARHDAVSLMIFRKC